MANDSGNLNNVTIKKEPLSNGSESVRLLSFGGPRDLSLGGLGPLRGRGSLSKKSVVPNLNVVRNKNTNVKTSKDTTAAGRGRNKGERGKGDRGRGRGRGGTLIQTAGVFSEGAGAINLRKTSSFRSSDANEDSSASIRKPTFIKRENKVDVKEEASQIKELVGDSDDDFEDVKTDLDSIPIKLSTTKWISSLKIKPENSQPISNNALASDTGDENAVVAENNSETLSTTDGHCDVFINADQIFSRLTTQLVLLQLPDSLPCVEEDAESGKKDLNTDCNSPEKANDSSMRQLEEGQIGKIVRYKSGKCKMVLGDTPFNVDMGMGSGFLQELMSISTNREERSGNMINLGPIQAKFTATPDWEYLFKKNS